MADLDKLVVRIEADLNDLKKGLTDAERKIKDSSGKMGNSFKKLDKGLINLGTSVVKFGSIFAATFGVLAIKDIIGVGVEIETLRIRFKALFGSAQEGAKAFDELLTFAGKVPFSLDEIQAGAGALAVVSEDAQELAKNLEITGNVAAMSGLTFVEAAQQIQRAFGAGAGAAEMLRDRGVLAMVGFEAGATVSAREVNRVFSELFRKGGKFGNLTNELADTVQGTLSMIQDSILQFKIAISNEFMQELGKQLNLLDANLKRNAKEIDRFGTDVGRSLARATATIVENLDSIGTAIEILGHVLLGSVLYKFARDPKILAIATVLAIIVKAVTQARNSYKKFHEEVAKNNMQLEDFLDIIKNTPDVFGDYELGTKKATKVNKEFGISLEDIIAILDESKKSIDDAGKEIADAFADAIVKGEDFKSAMKRIFQDAIAEIISYATHLLIIEPIIGRIKKAIDDLINAQKKQQKNQMINTALNLAGSIPFFANGGNVLPNRPIVVGEKGAELFVPKQAGDIIPNNQLSSGGGVTINQTLSFSTGVVPTVRAEVMNLLPVIKQETVNAVAETRSRGGTFARTFGA
tara:strand:+ start:774 stop:2510 length:1737 start_codon:yes stop_codon:yes gene_type:complete